MLASFPVSCIVERATAVRVSAESQHQTKGVQIHNIPLLGQVNWYLKEKECSTSMPSLVWHKGLFDLFKKEENEIDLGVQSMKESFIKRGNLKFSGLWSKLKSWATDACLQSKSSAREKHALQFMAACVLIFGSDLTMELQCSAAAVTDMQPYVANVKDSVELLPIPTNFPPLKDLVLPTFEKMVLPNGLRVFLLEDHELGLVGGQILVKGGSKDDPAQKVGLATISSIVQRSGGSAQYPAELLDAKLEEMVARIETSSSVSEMSVGFRCLSEDVPQVMSLFAEVVQHPLMPKNKLELTRTQLLGSIRRRGDNPEGIAAREFSKLIYGNESIYSRYFTEDTLKSIMQEDLVTFHKVNFRPTISVLGIWGDFDKATIKDIIHGTFGSWEVGDEDIIRQFNGPNMKGSSLLETGLSYFEPCVYVIDKLGLSQGFVRMGELGTTLADPDVFALDVLNGILNGFGGLLFDQVRSKEGIAYSVYGGWTPAVEHRGSFVAGGETQNDTIAQFIRSVERILESVTQSPPSEAILDRAKEGIINSFVFNFVDSGVQLSRLMRYELFGIDKDFLFNYKKKVEGLTGNDILEAAKRHLHPNSQLILVVTDVSKVKPILELFKMEVVELHPEYLPDK